MKKKERKRKRKHTILRIHPTTLGRTNCLSGSIFRPRRQFTAIGIPYAISNITTEAETMALKALDEPRKMQPKMMTRTTVKYSALRGTLSFEWTLEKKGDAGRPPSLFFVSTEH